MSSLYNLKKNVASIDDLIDGFDAGTFVSHTQGNSYFVDPDNGSDTHDGKTPSKAKATLAAAYALTTANQHDTVYFIGSSSADAPTSAITWSNSFTHLIGISADLPGMGQRCRVVNSAANDLTTLFTLSGSGCKIRNIQFYDGKDSAADGQCVVASGNRNHLENVFIAGMGDATASGPATRAGSFSLKVSGSENYFTNCTIGLDTIARSAANTELSLSGSRNTFEDCLFLSNSVTAGKFLVAVDNSGGDLRWNWFKGRCLFINYTSNWATGITNAFDMPAGGSTHYIVVGPECQIVGVGTGWADTLTHLYISGPQPNAGFGISTNPTT